MHKESQKLFTNAIRDEALRRFGLEGCETESLDGFESFVFSVQSSGTEEFILRITHSLHRTENEIQAEIEWINYLVSGGVPAAQTLVSLQENCVEVIRGTDGSSFVAVLFEKLQGHHPDSEEKDEKAYELLGEVIGRMHRLTQEFHFSHHTFSRRAWDHEVLEVSQFLPADEVHIQEKLQQLLVEIGTLPQERDSFGLIHTDAHWGNLFLHHESLKIFDFDDSAYMWFINDIAIIIFYGIMDRYPGLSEEQHVAMILKSLLKGYRREHTLSKEWIQRIPLFLKLREIDLYMVIHRSFDVENLEDEWCKSYMDGRRERIEHDVPYLDFDFASFDEHEGEIIPPEFIDRALDWARERVGLREYAFYCLAFVEDAYERSNSIEMFGGDDATESANLYGVECAGTPPKGALVFYHGTGPIGGITKDWGHVGLSLGDGTVIHAWDEVRIDDYRAVEQLNGALGWSALTYRGWTSPEVFLKGYVEKEYEGSPSYPGVSV